MKNYRTYQDIYNCASKFLKTIIVDSPIERMVFHKGQAECRKGNHLVITDGVSYCYTRCDREECEHLITKEDLIKAMKGKNYE